MTRWGERIGRTVAGLAAVVCGGGLWIVGEQIWLGLTTGRFRGKYGWIVQADRPIVFEIGTALNLFAALCWVLLGALAIWFACSRRLYRD